MDADTAKVIRSLDLSWSNIKPQDAECIACVQWKHGRNIVSYAEAEAIDASVELTSEWQQTPWN